MTYTNNSVNSNDSNKNNTKVRTTVIGLILLTIGLMIIFKNNSSKIVNLPNDVLSFYANNLKPLFYKTTITEEDVFNFALYQNIPIDKQNNRLLQIELDNKDEVKFNVKNALIKENTNNYNKFVDKLNLNAKQKKGMDSILQSYQDKIYKAVLVDENNAIAVDPKIAVLREALVFDINDYLMKHKILNTSDTYITKQFETGADKIFKKVKVDINESKDRNFVFISKDTVMNIECYIPDIKLDKKNHNKISVKIEKSDNKIKDKLYQIKDGQVIVKGKDINEIIAKVKLPILKKVIEIDKIKEPKINNINPPVIMIQGKDKNENTNFTFNYDDVGKIIEGSMQVINDENIKNWVQFGLKIDSLGNNISFKINIDSTFDIKELNSELEKAKNELNKLKKQKK